MSTASLPGMNASEYGVYHKAASRARLTYLRKHGSASLAVPDGARTSCIGGVAEWTSEGARAAHLMAFRAHAAEWHAEHDESYAAAAHKAGVSAVKSLHTRRIKAGWIAEGTARLEALGLAPKRRKSAAVAAPVAVESAPVESAAPVDVVDAARKSGKLILVSVSDTPAEPVDVPESVGHAGYEVRPDPASILTGPVCRPPQSVPLTAGDVDVRDDVTCSACLASLAVLDAAAVESEPVDVDDMPRQTTAAKRASNRELAADMRALGLVPSGPGWSLARAGVPLAELADMTPAAMVAAVETLAVSA